MLRSEIAREVQEGVSWQAIFDALRPMTYGLWLSLALEERARFLRHLQPWWDVHRPSTGIIRFRGQRIDRLRSDRIARQGIARTFQIMQPFAKLTVLDNVAAAALFAVGTPSLATAREEVRESLAFVGLGHIADTPAYSLPLAYRKRLELAKSLAMRPQLLLLDEVNAGLNATELDVALALIDQIAARGITILLIEHLMKVVLRASHRVVVLHHGVVIADDKPSAVMQDSAVIEAYLG